MTSDCIFCSHAILTPDAALRCKFTFNLAKEFCDNVLPGTFKVWKPESQQVFKKRRSSYRKRK